MSAPIVNLLPFPDLPNPFPRVLDTPRFRPLWDKWIDHRKAYKKPRRGWDRFFQEQLEWLAEFGEEAAYRAVETSYMNGWQGLFPKPGPLQPRTNAIPPWRVLQLLEEEARELENDLAYDFDRRKYPAKVDRQKIVKAQIRALREGMK